MIIKVGLVLLAAVLSIGGYFVLARLNEVGLSRDPGGIGRICFEEHLPEGTVHQYLEGRRVDLPTGTFTRVPAGIECEFTMTDGSTVRTAYPNYVATVAGALPLAATLGCGGWLLVNPHRPRRRNALV